ncbi:MULTISPECIES: hypothetical protein [unclassified Pseudomonas]|uniref:hypothetical protein n=1 Tax=unclassified Pseudomonas TaxID=196821 RepID=UPI002ACB1324|nr:MULTISPECIES: hypothetical protein [unclassified Pseudomonas]MEB0041948.1 hypothetical protein [Pseudomonas sp. MH10]MEB0090452.1 hypothetical protein [Pseudomonas sp. CCI4.2]MEB0123894.1 hypothetical protein [Pseudomonas sp. CCI1.2]WPX55713.1 hypothetical protein RHM65_09225 [Pseudomonas sp. CCI4.2]WPX63139.1 hypothetical protein RHM59_19840 [Pseudomonas sp. MH10]
MSDLWSVLPNIIVVVWSFLNIVFMLYLDVKKLDILEKYLEGSKWVLDAQTVFGGGIVGRNLRLHVVFGIILLPTPCYWRGLADRDAGNKIPKALRAIVLVGYTSFLMNFLAVFIV